MCLLSLYRSKHFSPTNKRNPSNTLSFSFISKPDLLLSSFLLFISPPHKPYFSLPTILWSERSSSTTFSTKSFLAVNRSFPYWNIVGYYYRYSREVDFLRSPRWVFQVGFIVRKKINLNWSKQILSGHLISICPLEILFSYIDPCHVLHYILLLDLDERCSLCHQNKYEIWDEILSSLTNKDKFDEFKLLII